MKTDKINSVYLCGKVSGLPKRVAQENFEEMYRYVLKNYKIGVKIINPLGICYPKWSWFKCMIKCLLALWSADAILIHYNYKHSKGAKIERIFAKIWGKKIEYYKKR